MRVLGIYIWVVLLVSCGKTSTPPAEPAAAPVAALLTAPAQNEACTTGIFVSATESKITLMWSASANTDSYELSIKNLLSNNSITQTTTGTQLELTLLKNTPYSWFITSKSSKTSATAKSETWKFYNSGPGLTSYAPYPAEIIAPTMNQSLAANAGKVTLKWNGSDADNDLASFDVYLGTTSNPSILQSNLAKTQTELAASVLSNTTYYWKIISKDAKGNSSDSGVFKFTIN